MPYSQNDEEEYILKHFGNHIGKFLDIGAYDGITLSNTRELLECGWSGDYIEPDPRNLVALIQNSIGKRVEICPVAASTKNGWDYLRIDSAQDRKWASSINKDNPGVLEQVAVDYLVPTVDINDLLQKDDYDFISIDAEHMDLALLKAADPNLLTCSLLCIEPSGPPQRIEMKAYLEVLGFSIYHETHENILARK
jgi:FkbM family methyltransferase